MVNLASVLSEKVSYPSVIESESSPSCLEKAFCLSLGFLSSVGVSPASQISVFRVDQGCCSS